MEISQAIVSTEIQKYIQSNDDDKNHNPKSIEIEGNMFMFF